MAKYCPAKNGTVLYLDCLECEEKICKQLNFKESEKANNKEQLVPHNYRLLNIKN